MNLYPERCIVTLSDTPNEPGRVQGVLGLDVQATTAECTLVAKGYSGQPRALLLRGYPRPLGSWLQGAPGAAESAYRAGHSGDEHSRSTEPQRLLALAMAPQPAPTRPRSCEFPPLAWQAVAVGSGAERAPREAQLLR